MLPSIPNDRSTEGERIKPRPNSAAATIPRFFPLSIDSRPTFVILNARISTIYRRREDEEEKKRRRMRARIRISLFSEFESRKIVAERQKCTHWKIDVVELFLDVAHLSFFLLFACIIRENALQLILIRCNFIFVL